MKELWRKTTRREKVAVIGAMAAVAFFLAYFMVVRPVRAELHRLRLAIPVKTGELAAMERMAGEAARLKALPGRTGAETDSPLKLIDQTARQAGVDQSLRRLEPAGPELFKVWLEEAVYVDLIGWLRILGAGHGINIVSLVVEPGGGAGLVNVRLSLGVRKDEGI